MADIDSFIISDSNAYEVGCDSNRIISPYLNAQRNFMWLSYFIICLLYILIILSPYKKINIDYIISLYNKSL
jgi:hypothetical protein